MLLIHFIWKSNWLFVLQEVAQIVEVERELLQIIGSPTCDSQ